MIKCNQLVGQATSERAVGMRRSKKAYKISLLISGVATAVGSGAMGIMLNYVIAEYALPASKEGWMSSLISTGAMIALVTGILLRGKIPKVGFIIFGGLLMSAMLVMKSIPVSFSCFLGICLLLGFGIGMIDSFQSAFLADLYPEDTAKNLGVFHGIFGIGGVVLPLVLHRMLLTLSWRTVYLIIGCFSFLLILQFIVMTARLKEEPVLKRVEGAQNFSQMRQFFQDSQFVLLLICMFFGAAAQNGILVWTVRYVSSFLCDTELAPVCLSVFWICSTVSRIFSPRIPVEPLKILAFGSLISGAAWGIGILSGNATAVLAACTIAGLSSGCCIPLLLNEGAGLSRNNTGLVTSVLMMIKTAGQMLSPIFVSSMQAELGMRLAVFLIGIIFIADGVTAAVMVWMKTQKRVHS